ncbi:polysaccharide deacetylase family protein [Marinifilum sp. N1E240]|uniref:polysaccharide deacetylase family protein n=1 Tax=Marinifilum sp. N1E240 TaxID=2608082 RepID=UPI00128D4CA4|nr:polysaccharide deacetylase family protein [Marinifilum sp. N1E240]MPQ46462.1 polysaccharide deacetylase family protein [Marinifilum sp. N1E240]
MKNGKFVISLDFEKYWGIRDHSKISDYKTNLDNVDTICFRLLNLFSKYKIHTTWATVGFLLFDNKKELIENIPHVLPLYYNKCLDPYSYAKGNDLLYKYHFANEIIKEIINTDYQEVASHTFSHYYCLEAGQDKNTFKADLGANIDWVKRKYNIDIKSIVLPRNQVNCDYIDVLRKMNISSYRGNEDNWLYNSRMNNVLKRIFRLIDSYINITGYNTCQLEKKKNEGPLNIPSSRFLRPVSNKLFFLEKIRLRRIKRQMTNAARKNELFHLWWHPHNFGMNMDANFVFLEKILLHYVDLNEKYNMVSLNMGEVCLEK